MAFAVAVPLCGWFLAACVSSSVSWSEDGASSSVSSCSERKRRTGGRSRALYHLRCGSSSSNNGRNSAVSSALPLATRRMLPAASSAAAVAAALPSQASVISAGEGGLRSCLVRRSEQLQTRRGAARGGRRSRGIALASLSIASEQAAPATASRVEGGVEGGEQQRGTAVRQRRVVVTGMGVVSALGMEPDEFYNNLLEGKCGISTIQGFNTDELDTKIAGEILDFDSAGFVHPKMAKRMDKYMRYLLTAGKKAVQHAGMTDDVRGELNKMRCGVLIGSAMGGMQIFNDAVDALRVSHRRMNPFCIPFVTTNMGSAMLAMDLGWMGPNYSISTACATANVCILSAANHILRGEADVMLSGGSDAAVLPLGLAGFSACNSLSRRNHEPEAASRPWSEDGDGFVIGEGCGVLVLEELQHAKARGATIYAEFLGGSVTCDAFHPTDPHPQGEGLLLCMKKAVEESGVRPEEINYINAHAASTPLSDVLEYRAIMEAFGSNPTLRMNATKSMLGHLLGASGGVEAVATVQAINTGWLHPTINIGSLHHEMDSRVIVGGKKEKLDVKVALSNSFGFGGHNSSILFAPYDPSRYQDE